MVSICHINRLPHCMGMLPVKLAVKQKIQNIFVLLQIFVAK